MPRSAKNYKFSVTNIRLPINSHFIEAFQVKHKQRWNRRGGGGRFEHWTCRTTFVRANKYFATHRPSVVDPDWLFPDPTFQMFLERLFREIFIAKKEITFLNSAFCCEIYQFVRVVVFQIRFGSRASCTRNDFFRIRIQQKVLTRWDSDPQHCFILHCSQREEHTKRKYSGSWLIYSGSDLRKVPGSNPHLDLQRQYTQGKIYQTKWKNTYFNCIRHGTVYSTRSNKVLL